MEVVVIPIVPIFDSSQFSHLVKERSSWKGSDQVQTKVVHIFSKNFKKVITVSLCFIPMSDQERCHHHQFMFLQKFHRLDGLLDCVTLLNVLKHGIRMIFESHHKLVDPGFPEALQ